MIMLPRQAEQAIQFYEASLGAKCNALTRYKEFPNVKSPPDGAELIVYSDVSVGSSKLMIIDGLDEFKPECLSTPQV